MNQNSDDLKREWNARSQQMGATHRSVLFKRFPGLINGWIHRQHVNFILEQMPPQPSRVLDVGCGYGRLSSALKRQRPNDMFQGVDFAEEFAREYELNVGPCFCGSAMDYQPKQEFDVILMVTILMYLDESEQYALLHRLWDFLRPQGRLIVIEPALELLQAFRLITRRKNASPTGGNVGHFTRRSLTSLVGSQPRANVLKSKKIVAIPLTQMVPVHHAIAVGKKGRESRRQTEPSSSSTTE